MIDLGSKSLEWLTPLPLQHGEPARLRLHFRIRAPVAGASIIVGFNSLAGARVLTYQMDNRDTRRDIGHPGTHSVDLLVDPMILGPDIYDVDVASRSGDFHALDSLRSCAQLEVTAGPKTPPFMFQVSRGALRRRLVMEAMPTSAGLGPALVIADSHFEQQRGDCGPGIVSERLN